MKRVLLIILAVVAIVVILGLSFAGLSSRNSQNRSLDVYGAPVIGLGGGGGGDAVAEAPAAAMEPPGPELAYDEASSAVKSVESGSTSGQEAQQERKIIQTADLAIVVEDPQARASEISRMAQEMGGYVVSSNVYQSYTSMNRQVPEATIVIRVPAERLDEALVLIKKDAGDVQYENRSGQDVTNVYVDLQAQLKAKEAAEAQLLQIMEDAVRAEDVLAVYMQVQSIQTEIEQLKGQIKYYDEAAALSSISVRLVAEESTQPIEVGPWTPTGAAKDAVEDLILFVQNFVDFLIRFAIYVLPALILIAIPIALVFLAGRAIYRRSRKSRAAVEAKDIEKQ